jgi:hypothetical protein
MLVAFNLLLLQAKLFLIFGHFDLSQYSVKPKKTGQTHLNLRESEESPVEETESWPGRIIEAQQARVFGFTGFSAL